MAGGCWAATFRFSKFLSVILLRTMSSPSLERISFLPPSLMVALETGWRVAMFGELIANSGRPTKIWIDGGHASHAEQSAAAAIREGDLLKVVGLGRIEAGVEAIESCERPIEKGVVSDFQEERRHP